MSLTVRLTIGTGSWRCERRAGMDTRWSSSLLPNGALRDRWYGKHLGALQAHQLSTVSVSCCSEVHLGGRAPLETCVRWTKP